MITTSLFDGFGIIREYEYFPTISLSIDYLTFTIIE